MTMTKDNGTKEKPYLALSDTDRKILESYRTMIPNLGEYLGEGYEIILHSLENLQHSVGGLTERLLRILPCPCWPGWSMTRTIPASVT